jgi:hypothetical protein
VELGLENSMKGERVAIYVGVTVVAVVVFGLLVVMDNWVELAPWPLSVHVGGLAFALSFGVYLWLRKPPNFGSGGTRRRRRLRDRYRDPDAD